MAVVIGFIPDEYGEAALAAGLEEAQRRGTGVVVVNLGAGGTSSLERRLADSGVDHELRQTLGQDIADAILTAAEEITADAIVIGIRHRSPVGKLILGSVAHRVIVEAACPVVAVKP